MKNLSISGSKITSNHPMKVCELGTLFSAAHLISLGPRALLCIKCGPCCCLGSPLPLAQAQKTPIRVLPSAAPQAGWPSRALPLALLLEGCSAASQMLLMHLALCLQVTRALQVVRIPPFSAPVASKWVQEAPRLLGVLQFQGCQAERRVAGTDGRSGATGMWAQAPLPGPWHGL